ncbi:hypothetical protein [Catelliglobosispora koreensis]|uniref:hypothetical protein n=1 Tax=Catelliglobosispora koreensis TaxID=129052 RepID=UPI0003681FCC|nr:hypothetical protein [Catelliglobosispora koreensis]
MDLSAFYSVISGINFTLLGLWWVAARERKELRDTAGRRTAYLVSLGFVIPGTVSLLSQISPETPFLWRISFAVAGIAGAIGTFLLSSAILKHLDAPILGNILRYLATAAYVLVTIVALFPRIARPLSLSGLQAEAILLSLLVFLGVQAAWVVAMTPSRAEGKAGLDHG